MWEYSEKDYRSRNTIQQYVETAVCCPVLIVVLIFLVTHIVSHTSCVTEAEKYQGHLYQAKDKENKGETKQKEWLRSVQGTSSQTADPKLRNLPKKLTAYSNIPRKKKKFDNFCKNSVNVYDAKTLDQLWDLFTGGNDAGKQTND
eukprot:UN00373